MDWISHTRRSFAIVAALFAVCFIFNASGVYAVTFVVNSTTDANDINPGDGVCTTTAAAAVCSLRAAITEANALAGADIITLPAGTYTQTLVGVNDNNAAGDLDIRGNLTINGAGSGTTIIQANANPGVAVERVIDFPNANVTAVFNEVTIQNGRQPTATFGGGVRVNTLGDNVTFNNCFISNNFSGFGGGGIYMASGTIVTLNNTTVTENTAASTTAPNTGSGGGIFLNGIQTTLIANNSTISNNTSSSTTIRGANGGGIGSFGTVTLTGSTVSGNTVSSTGAGSLGGGIYNTGATMALTNTTVSGNTATASSTFDAIGGGIGHINGGTMDITDSVISNNNASVTGTGAGFAGGIYNQQATLTLTRSTVSGNTAPIHAGIRTLAAAAATTTINQSAVVNNISGVEGGGVINASIGAAAATTNINNSTIGGNTTAGSAAGVENFNTDTGAAIVNINYSTIAGNMANTDNAGADVGGGIANVGGGTGASTVNLTSSIVADNTIGTTGTGPDISGVITSANYNHVENTAGGTFIPLANDVTGVDPQLTPLALNGGTTLNYLPAATSPVLDTIPNGMNGCGTTFTVDQRGIVRPTDSNNDALAACEKGSVEVLAPTAAMASISGRVLSGFDGRRGLANATIKMTDAAGVTRLARTNAFGYFQLADVATGQTYIFDVSAKRYQFQTQVVNVSNDLTDLNFTPLYYKPVSK